MGNHIIIGLGGTGGTVIKNYRQQIIDKFGKIDGINELKSIKFIYIDSNKDELFSPWQYQGKRIGLQGDDLILLDAGKLNERLQNYSTRPAWIGNESDWGGMLKEDISQKAGNQLRRLGRVNLIAQFRTIIDKIDQKKNLLGNDSTDLGTTIHIVTGLAGGTGSGSIVDICAGLCAANVNDDYVFINLYLVLPETGIVNSKAGQFDGISYLKKNGYAALKELNSFSTGKFKPYNIEKKNSRIDTPKKFQAAYIFTEKNSKNVKFSDNTKIASIASFLFLKTITTQKEKAKTADGNIDQTTLPGLLNKIDTAENNMATAESYWGLTDKFRVPGIFKLAVPKVQIRESFAYLLVLNTFNKLLYKNFDEVSGQGYLGEKSSDTSTEKAKNQIITNLHAAILDEWYLEYDFLILDKPMLDDKVFLNEGVNDITIETAYINEYNKQYTLLTGTKQYKGAFIKDNELLKYIQIEINNFFTQRFKADGFETYYNNMQRNLLKKAEFIADRIKKKLVGTDSGKYSRAYPMEGYIDLLDCIIGQYFTKLENDLKNKQAEYRKIADAKYNELNTIKNEFVSTYSIIGSILDSKSKREKAITNFNAALKDFWCKTIALRGIDYAISLIPHLKNKLLEAKVDIENDVNKIKERRDTINKEYLDEKRKIEGDEDVEGFKSVANNKKLEDFQRSLLKNKGKFEPLMVQLERGVFENKNEVVNQNIGSKKLSIMESAFNMVDDILSEKNISELIGEEDTFYNANIIALLHKKYKGNANDPELLELLADMDKRSAPMATINSLNKGNITTKHEKLIVIPRIESVKDSDKDILQFYQAFINTIKNTIQGAFVKELSGPDIKNEISICQFFMPIRADQINNIIELKNDYDNDKNAPQMLFLVHTENCYDLEELEPPKNPDEFKDMLLPFLLILNSAENGFQTYGIENYWMISGEIANKNDSDDNGESNNFIMSNSNLITIKFECGDVESFLRVSFDKLERVNTHNKITSFIHPDVYRITEKLALDHINGNADVVIQKCKSFLEGYLAKVHNDVRDKNFIRFNAACVIINKIINAHKN